MAEVVLDHIAKSFKDPKGQTVAAVNDLSLRVADGEFVALVGPSGSGKTTLLRIIAGLESIDQGSISIGGQVMTNVQAKDRDIGMVFQNYALYPHMTAFENLAFPLKLRKVPRAKICERVGETVELLGIGGLLERFPHELSGGEKQRVAVGRAIVRSPRVFLFDEPLSNLDANMRIQLRIEILRLHQQLGATMIYVTHDQLEAMTMGQRLAVMRQGTVQQLDTPSVVYHRPATCFVARFIGSPPMNVFKGIVVSQGAQLSFVLEGQGGSKLPIEIEGTRLEQLRSRLNRPVILGLRPEDLRLVTDQGAAADIHATVELNELTGPVTFVHLCADGTHFVARREGSHSFRAGERILVHPDMRKAHFFDPDTEQRLE